MIFYGFYLVCECNQIKFKEIKEERSYVLLLSSYLYQKKIAWEKNESEEKNNRMTSKYHAVFF
jgi:hypothetical protein